MSKYKCSICGYIYDEQVKGKPIKDIDNWRCPNCNAEIDKFEIIQSQTSDINIEGTNTDLDYPKEYARTNDSVENYMDMIHTMAVQGKSIIEPMKTKLDIISWNDILIMGAQLNPLPLDEHDSVNTQTIIGKKANKPMIIESPVYITHMSFGALSKEIKIALAKGSAKNKTAMCSGEGGILPEEMEQAYKYIFEYVPNKYSVNPENFKRVDAIEIKIGQGTKPGMGGHLPGEKVTQEISRIRDKPMGKDIISPSRFKDINSKDDLKNLVEQLRMSSEGKPIGIKIAAGHIERDMEYITYANPDFITIDGRGGATGASPKFLRDATSVPTIFALYRAKKYLDEHKLEIDLVITGGLRISSDFMKAIAMGATAIAIGTSALVATACQQYRICTSGMCPVGVATQDEELRKRLDIEASSKRLENFLNVTLEELKIFARISGHNNIHSLTVEDLCTVNSEISNYTNIKHV